MMRKSGRASDSRGSESQRGKLEGVELVVETYESEGPSSGDDGFTAPALSEGGREEAEQY